MKNETAFVNELRLIFESVGSVFFKTHGHGMQEAGWPDIYVAHPYWTGWLEAKYKDRETTALQHEKIALLNRCKVPAMSIRWRDGIVTAELRSTIIGTFDSVAWRVKMGQERAWTMIDWLLEMSAICIK